MANEKIHEYVKTRTSGTVDANFDYIDVDSSDDSGLSYESAKMTMNELRLWINSTGLNIYVSDGTLTGNRTVTANTFYTRFVGGDVVVEMADETFDYAFLVKNVSSVEKARFGYDQGTLSSEFVMEDGGGIFVEARDSQFYVNTNTLSVDNNNRVGINILAPTVTFDVGLGATNDEIALYANRGGGALVSDNSNINFYFNDSGGVRTKANNNIYSRLPGAPGAGVVNNDLIIGKQMKVLDNGAVMIHPNVATQPAGAFFDVKQDATSTFNTCIQGTTKGNTASQQAIWLKNLAGQTLFRVNGVGAAFFNTNNLTTADFQMEGGTNANLFYMDASVDAIGFGTNTPNASSIVEFSSTTRGVRYTPMTVAQAGAITPVEGLVLFVSDTDGTFPTIGLYSYQNGAWAAL